MMTVVTIPAATHSVDIDLRSPCQECAPPSLGPVGNKIVIDAQDHMLWNGYPVAPSALTAILGQVRNMPVEPELQLEPAARASYELSARTLATVNTSSVTRLGFESNERYRDI